MIHAIALSLALQFSSVVQRIDRNVRDRSIEVTRAETAWRRCLNISVENTIEAKAVIGDSIFAKCLNEQETYHSALVASYGDTEGLDAKYLASRDISSFKKHFGSQLETLKK